jgi:hypothetical protein
MTYDDWKLRSDRDERPEDEPSRCVHLYRIEEECPVCDEPGPCECVACVENRMRRDCGWTSALPLPCVAGR